MIFVRPTKTRTKSIKGHIEYLVKEKKELRELGTPLGAFRVGMDEIEAKVPQEEFLHEARVLPGGLSSLFGDAPGVFFTDVDRLFCAHVTFRVLA